MSGSAPLRIGLFDYGAGNLHSLLKGIERWEGPEGERAETTLCTDPEDLLDRDGILLPGVGAFGPAATALGEGRVPLRRALEGGLPCLGICLGMHLLLEGSEEGPGEGVGFFRGRVRRLDLPVLPHMGWNDVAPRRSHPLFPTGAPMTAYFAHSYAADPEEEGDLLATTEVAGTTFPTALSRGEVHGVQFHPEKSSREGIALLHAFLDRVAALRRERNGERPEARLTSPAASFHPDPRTETMTLSADRRPPAGPRRAPFLAIPAVDLKGGRCVQLVGGKPEEERISLPDPAEIAERWLAAGFTRLHVIDLDAALGSGDNLPIIEAICARGKASVQVGGGIRSEERAGRILEAGAERIILGTRAIEDPDWLAAMAARFPGRVIVAADLEEGVVLTRGWRERSGLAAEEYVASLGTLPLAGILCTDVGREGRLEGIDEERVTGLIRASAHPLWISGGVTTMEDLRVLDDAGAAGAVLGMALYTGSLDPITVAGEWGR